MRIVFLVLAAAAMTGCSRSNDPRVNVRGSAGNDNIVNNYVTRPVAAALSAVAGQGIVVDKVVLERNPSGFLEVNVLGHNNSYSIKKFRYRVEWLDEKGLPIETKTSVWLPMSAMGNQPFGFKAVAPRVDAVDFRLDTRKWE